MKSKKVFKIKPVFLLVAAAVLLLASTVGSTQAALTYHSDNYIAQVNVSNIDVTLLENGETAGTLLDGKLIEHGTDTVIVNGTGPLTP